MISAAAMPGDISRITVCSQAAAILFFFYDRFVQAAYESDYTKDKIGCQLSSRRAWKNKISFENYCGFAPHMVAFT